MKSALPLTASDEFSPHYGAAAKFAVFDVDPTHRAVRRQLVVVPEASEPCQWPRFLRTAGVDLFLAGGMGQGARQHMADHGVKVLLGVAPAAPAALIEAWLAGRLTGGANACDGSGQSRHHHAAGHTHEDGACHCGH
jgi:ATP-binding protein involved in chromosome partitioning